LDYEAQSGISDLDSLLVNEASSIEKSVLRLQFLIDIVPSLLLAADENELSRKPSPDKWSKKEIIGHLIDSATNNHHRFVRGQFEENPSITYDQNAWNKNSYYSKNDCRELIAFWEAYNRHLLSLIRKIPEHLLNRTVNTGGDSPLSIGFLIIDYVKHLEHHLMQIIDISQIDINR
jgi:hypothetical protein